MKSIHLLTRDMRSYARVEIPASESPIIIVHEAKAYIRLRTDGNEYCEVSVWFQPPKVKEKAA
jgi:hypothetical protein